MPDANTPSLLEPESRGGESAGRGFDFQDHFLASQIPQWLAWDGFISVLHEAIGDIEVKMYSPSYGESIEMIEAKNFRLTPVVFWSEIDRFYAADKGSPNTFRWFRLVAPDISDELSPLQNGLRRLRSPYGFYPADSGVIQNSIRDFEKLVSAANKPIEYADFLFRRVLVDIGYDIAQQHGEALFRQNLGVYLPEYSDLTYSVVSAMYRELLGALGVRNTQIQRRDIERTLRAVIPDGLLRQPAPVRLHTLHQAEEEMRKELVLNWAAFFGGSTRTYPDAGLWNERVVEQLHEVKSFILTHRNTRHIQITGSRRLSSTFALGAVFSATSGFTLSMKYRDDTWWITNAHAGEHDQVALEIEHPQGLGDQLIVSLGIPKNIRASVEHYVHLHNAGTLPLLNIYSTQPIENARQANAIVAQVKSAIRDALTQTQASRIHLFCAVPSFLALLLGHRLNATAQIQCYEFVGPEMYVPTCLIVT